MDLKQIISYLTILELPYDKPLVKENVTTQYRQLAQIYHPDTANPRYKDGERFKELRKAYDFVIKNIDEINEKLGFDNVETCVPKSVSVSASQYNNNLDVSVVNKRTSRRQVFIAIGIVLGVFAIIGLITGIILSATCKHSNMYIYKTTVTCEVFSYDYYKCNDCGYEKQLYKSASGHNWLEKSNVGATCTTGGKITYECNNCHQTKYTTSNALGHSISNSFTCSSCHKDVYKILLNDKYPRTVEDYYSYEYLQERNQSFLMSKVTINKVTYSYSPRIIVFH